MATETAPNQTDTPAKTAEPTKPSESPKAAAPANTKTAAKPRPRKRAPKSRTRATAKSGTTAKSRTRATAKSSTRATAKSRKPAAARTSAPASTAAPKRQPAKPQPNGGQQILAGILDTQEKTVTALVDYQTRAAELSQIPGAAAIAGAQAQALRSVTDVYVTAARSLLK